LRPQQPEGESVEGRFQSWACGEPNNSSSIEHFAVTNWNNSKGLWNDLSGTNSSSVTGYVVEYSESGGQTFTGVATVQTGVTSLTYELLGSNGTVLDAVTQELELGPAGTATKLIRDAGSQRAERSVPLAEQPVLSATDTAGRQVAHAGDVVVSIHSGPAGGALVCSGGGDACLTKSLVGSTARFTGITIDGPAGIYTLRFAVAGLQAVDMNVGCSTRTMSSSSMRTCRSPSH
jgi:hypothetical protein